MTAALVREAQEARVLPTVSATVMIRMDFPPSVNTAFPTRGKRRVPSEAYRAWRDAQGWSIKAQRVPMIRGPVNVRIDLVAPDRRRRDCDNYAKGPLDALVKAGVIEDDSNIRRLSIGWEEEGPACLVTVTAIERTKEASL